MTRFRGAPRRIAVLASSMIAACAIDSRVGTVEPPAEGDSTGADNLAAAAGNTGNEPAGSGSQVAPGADPGPSPPGSDGMQTGIAPVLPAAAGSSAGGGSSSPAAPGTLPGGTLPAGSAGQGAGGAGSGPGADPPPPVTEPELIGGCFNQLLRNGDFERGREGWTELSPLRDVIVWRDHAELLPTGVTPQAGNYLAWIGGIPSGEFMMYRTRLEQQVAIPAETLSLTFSGYVWAAQPEPGLANPDWAILEVVDPEPSSSYLWRVQYWEDSATAGWVYFEQTWTDVARFAGKMVPVQVHNMPNANGLLSVWLDSLRLEARCAR